MLLLTASLYNGGADIPIEMLAMLPDAEFGIVTVQGWLVIDIKPGGQLNGSGRFCQDGNVPLPYLPEARRLAAAGRTVVIGRCFQFVQGQPLKLRVVAMPALLQPAQKAQSG